MQTQETPEEFVQVISRTITHSILEEGVPQVIAVRYEELKIVIFTYTARDRVPVFHCLTITGGISVLASYVRLWRRYVPEGTLEDFLKILMEMFTNDSGSYFVTAYKPRVVAWLGQAL